MVAVLGGLDPPVFPGDIGERRPRARTSLCRGRAFAGVAVDGERHTVADQDTGNTAAGTRVRVAVEPREDLRIVRGVSYLTPDDK